MYPFKLTDQSSRERGPSPSPPVPDGNDLFPAADRVRWRSPRMPGLCGASNVPVARAATACTRFCLLKSLQRVRSAEVHLVTDIAQHSEDAGDDDPISDHTVSPLFLPHLYNHFPSLAAARTSSHDDVLILPVIVLIGSREREPSGCVFVHVLF